MKKLILIYFFFLIGDNFIKAQTTLVAGDIAIIAYIADGTDDFSFIPLKDLAAGTVINFTDFGWISESNGFQLSFIISIFGTFGNYYVTSAPKLLKYKHATTKGFDQIVSPMDSFNKQTFSTIEIN